MKPSDDEGLRDEIKSLDIVEIDILKVWLDRDDEYYYPYRFFERKTGHERKALEKAMSSLRSKGMVTYARGLMDEDGQVAGSGHGIKHEVWRAIQDMFENEIEQSNKLDSVIFSIKYGKNDLDEDKAAINKYMEALISQKITEARVDELNALDRSEIANSSIKKMQVRIKGRIATLTTKQDTKEKE